MKKLFFSLFFSLFCLGLFSQIQTTVEEIIDNPGPFIEEKVVVEGTVKQFVPETSTTNAHYLLEGKYGGILTIKTDESEPVKNKEYRVVGTVYSESGKPFIHERSKVCLDCDGPPPPPISMEPTPWWREGKNLLYIIIGGSVLLLALIIIFVVQSNRSRQRAAHRAFVEEEREIEMKEDVAPSVESVREDFSTIKISYGDPKTMKFIPGRLEIISGDDKGKSFRMAGFPTAEGSIITIGRKQVTGDRAYAHIAIDHRFQTVSRMQAELNYRNGIITVKNLSETNFTQVDGVELKPGQTAELKPGSVMKTGELEFKYVV